MAGQHGSIRRNPRGDQLARAAAGWSDKSQDWEHKFSALPRCGGQSAATLEATHGQMDGFLVNSHTDATRIGWHLWGIDLIFAPGLPPGWGGRPVLPLDEGYFWRDLSGLGGKKVVRVNRGARWQGVLQCPCVSLWSWWERGLCTEESCKFARGLDQGREFPMLVECWLLSKPYTLNPQRSSASVGLTILQATCWVCDTNSSILERRSARAHQISETKWTETETVNPES